MLPKELDQITLVSGWSLVIIQVNLFVWAEAQCTCGTVKSKIFVQLSIKICQYYQWLRSVACLLSIMSSNVKVVHPLENFLICDRCAKSWKKGPDISQILLQGYFVNAVIITQIMMRFSNLTCLLNFNKQHWNSIFTRLHLSSRSVLVKFTILQQKNAHRYPTTHLLTSRYILFPDSCLRVWLGQS